MSGEASREADLRGARVVVPVTAGRRDLADGLRARGAVVLEAECIAIAPATDQAVLRAAVERWCAGGYDWMAVTSRNAVSSLARVCAEAGLALGSVTTPVATVGEATRRACAEAGLTVGLVPDQEDARGLVSAFPAGSGRVLAPLGNRASAVLPDGLRAKGWVVDALEAYRTVDGPGLSAHVRASLTDGTADAVVLTSGSVAQRVRRDLGEASVHPHVAVVAIGDMTAQAASAASLEPRIVAGKPTYDGILEALAAVLEEPT